MRVAQAVVLEEDVRRKLEQQARGRLTPVRVALRSRIVLLAAEGLLNEQIAAQIGTAPRTVARQPDRGRLTSTSRADALITHVVRNRGTPIGRSMIAMG